MPVVKPVSGLATSTPSQSRPVPASPARLLVGVAAAKALALTLDKPLYGVNHLSAHVAVDQLRARAAARALRGAAGQRRALEPAAGRGRHHRGRTPLGATVDDAAGEAFDKVARLLGLPFPGGPHIDRAAREGGHVTIDFPRGLTSGRDLERHRFDFSFSGLKTAVARWVEARERSGEPVPVADVAASFQEAVCDVLTRKAIDACVRSGADHLVIGGGVAANSRIRVLAEERAAQHGIVVRVPRPGLCTDNGAMVAALGSELVRRGRTPSAFDLPADSSSPELVQSDIPLASEKGGVGIHLAEHAFALLLGLTRGMHTAIRRPDYGLREPIRLEQRELFESTMGIVGFGGVGREVARRALGFGMRVIGVDVEDVPPEPGVPDIWKTDRLYEMLGLADVVVIGLPLTKATRHLFTRDLFRRMKRTAILINVTRGEIIYGEDLLAALDEGLIWGAGLDVTDPEPLAKDHRLWTHPRVIVTPHTAGGSPRRAQRVIDTFCENLRRMRAGQPFIALIDKDKGY